MNPTDLDILDPERRGSAAIPGDDIITEGSDLMVSETGDQLTTE